MDEKRPEKETGAGTRRPAGEPERPERGTRAAAYLDLWERHVTHAAVYGPDPAPLASGG
jgi:hypothetical protein